MPPKQLTDFDVMELLNGMVSSLIPRPLDDYVVCIVPGAAFSVSGDDDSLLNRLHASRVHNAALLEGIRACSWGRLFCSMVPSRWRLWLAREVVRHRYIYGGAAAMGQHMHGCLMDAGFFSGEVKLIGARSCGQRPVAWYNRGTDGQWPWRSTICCPAWATAVLDEG